VSVFDNIQGAFIFFSFPIHFLPKCKLLILMNVDLGEDPEVNLVPSTHALQNIIMFAVRMIDDWLHTVLYLDDAV